MSEYQWPLPKSWKWVLTSEIAEIVGGGTPAANDPTNFDETGIAWITPADLTNYAETYIGRGRRDLSKKGLNSSGARLMPAGTVLYSSRAPIGYCVIATSPISTNQGFKSLVLKDGISPEYIRYYLLSAKEYAESIASGTTFKELSGSRMATMPIPLAPNVEQRRIVAKLDNLLGSSSRARTELERLPALIERYKQAILAKAFSGDLTADWRTEHEVSKNSWQILPISNFAKVGTGATPKRGEKRYYEGGKFAWVTSGAITSGYISEPSEMITEAALRETNCSLYPSGSLLLALYGEGQTRGRVAILGIEAATNQACAAIRINDEAAIARNYLFWFLQYQYGEIRMAAAGGVQPNLNLSIVKAISVPVPTIQEQKEIISRLGVELASIKRTYNEATRATALLDRLEQATLSKAFQGELLPPEQEI